MFFSFGHTNILDLSYTARNPQLAADICNTLIANYVEHNFSQNYAATQQVSDWLQRQLGDLRKRLEASQEHMLTVQKDIGLNRQLGIAPGTNFRLRGSTGIEFVVQLPIIQAPFRIYYAYNVHRLHSQLLAPPDFIEATEICDPSLGDKCGVLGRLPATLPSDVWKFQVRPTIEQLLKNPGSLNYFEPARTFRFTVSRTF